MVHFPVRKCYYIAKVSLLMVLVVTLLGLFEKWRGGKRAASAMDPREQEYEREILEDEARIIPGLGEGGVAAYLTGKDQELGEQSEKKLAMNVYLSDRIAYNRTLKDQRNPACARVTYDAELPSASVILIFHNEPYSVVIRTIWSVINSCRRENPWFRKANYIDKDGRKMKLGYPGQDESSPLLYLKEIILVDDNSTLPDLKGKLSHYVRTRLPPDLIRILRLPDRRGLTQARQAGSRVASGTVMIFLDSHCEGAQDWLRPLLHRIKDKRNAVVTPLIDTIEQNNFKYQWGSPNDIQVGGFTFTGHFTWIDVSPEEKKRRGSEISPTWSPTMAGGLFAINREYYWEVGAYDEQMAGWGGENLEMSFRIWQCGGTLETIPCSRVGHVFRSFHPYSMPSNSDTHGINTARMAEVWMDEYAELFYLHRPDLRKSPKIGDVTHRKVLREKLRCKNFQWFLDNIYKEKFVPVRDTYGYGRFRNPATNLCIDTMQREGADHPLGVYQCHADLQATQYLSLSLSQQLRDEESCAQIQFNRPQSSESYMEERQVIMSNCHGRREQKWQYLQPSRQIQHVESRLCLSAGRGAGRGAGGELTARACSDAPDQRWEIDYSEENDFRKPNEIGSSELEHKLSRLRGQRRKSRSLLSYNPEVRRHRKKKRQKHRKHVKKTKTKNKFILKLIRTLTNNTEEHLEMDIHCRHRQLFPNNTFVRDLVTIFNDNNIKVINNGRVFEKNKVTQLDPKLDEDWKVLNKLDVSVEKPQKKTRKHKPKVFALENAIDKPGFEQNAVNQPGFEPNAVNQPGLEQIAIDRMNAIDANVSDTSVSPRSHRIIIEDFVEMSPKHSKSRKHKKKKKRKRISPPLATPTVVKGEGDKEKGGNLAARSVEEQINGPLPLSTDSIEDSPMLSESETNSRTNERDSKHDKRKKRKKHLKIAKKTSNEMSERERDGLQSIDKDSDLEVWDVGESKFRTGDDVDRRRGIESEKSDTDLPGDTITENPEDADGAWKNATQNPERTDDAPGSQKPEVLDPNEWYKTPKSEYRDQISWYKTRQPIAVGHTEWLKTSTPEVNVQTTRLESIKPEVNDQMERETQTPEAADRIKLIIKSERNSDKTVQYGNFKENVNDLRKAGKPEVKYRKLKPEVIKQTKRRGNTDLESDGSDESDKTLEEWSGEVTKPTPVKVVMKSNLTFNLGEEFFKWRSNTKQGDTDSERSVSTRRAPSAHAWKLSGDVTHSSEQITEPDMKDSEERSNSSSESASSE